MQDANAVPPVTGADLFADESTDTVDAPVEYDKGTWQATLNRSARLFDKSATERKTASKLLWTGAVTGIEDWLPNADTDVSAEAFGAEVTAILGKPRKGDASKIKTVALAVKNNGLILSLYPNLAKAYAEARRLTQTVAQEKSEDAAADKAIEALAAETPNSASTPENAAKIVLSKGLDEAARVLLDALGASNDAAHRAFMRAISQEIAGRVKPKVSTVKAGPKAGATQAKTGGKPAAKAKPVTQPAKAKQTADTSAKPTPVAKPVVPVKGKPVIKGRPVAVKAG